MEDTNEAPLKAKVIFNPQSGRSEEAPVKLADILTHLQKYAIVPEVHIFQPGDDLFQVADEAVRRGIELVIACGGDGTISSVANALINTYTRLAIIPTGTQNNQAFVLGIPTDDLDAAARITRYGRPVLIDTGLACCGAMQRSFTEIASLGLTSVLFPATDDFQHGDIGKLGEVFRILLAHPLTHIEADLDGVKHRVEADVHTALVTNIPYTGARWRLAEDVSFEDGLLDVFFFSEMGKLDLINAALQASGGPPEDERIWHYQVQRATFRAAAPMPVMVDGEMMGDCALSVEVQPKSLWVMSNLPGPAEGET